MDSSKLAAVLQKRQSERAQAKQPVAAPVTQVAVVTPVGPALYPALWQTLQKKKKQREEVVPKDREALEEFMHAQNNAVKKTTKKDCAPAEDVTDWSFTVRPGLVLMIAAVTYVITIVSQRF